LRLGLLREEGEPGGQVLRKSGVTFEKARELIKQQLEELPYYSSNIVVRLKASQ
jgi:hypothetical protein